MKNKKLGTKTHYTSRGITKHEDVEHTTNLKHGTMWVKKLRLLNKNNVWKLEW
jgi:hypothetical protein